MNRSVKIGKLIRFLALGLIGAALVPADTRASEGCSLDAAKDGQSISVEGKAVQLAHDLGFEIVGCPDTVILVYAGDQDTHVSGDRLRWDNEFKRFQKYTSATYRGDKKHLCLECAQYDDVRATLSGQLEVAALPTGTTRDDNGFLHDKSGKLVGTSGFGHSTAKFKYRLILTGAADVHAHKLPKPRH